MRDHDYAAVRTAAVAGLLLLTLAVSAGCITTTEMIEYDATGAIVKRTIAQRSTADKLGEVTKDHSYVSIRKGWYASLSVATVTTESPTPGVDAEAGNVTFVRALLARNQQSLEPIMAMIRQVAGTELSITRVGINGASGASDRAAAD